MISARLWSTGMINQLMSLEVMVGLSALLKKEFRVYNLWDQYDPIGVSSPVHYRYMNRLPELIGKETVKRLPDILDWDNEGWILEDKNQPDEIEGHVTQCLFDKHYVNCQPQFHDGEDEFRGNFEVLELDPSINYNFINVISFYCRCFFNRTKEVEDALKKIQWKQPYVDLANDIAKDLGTFSAIHLRDTDNFGTIKIHPRHFENGINEIAQHGHPIILATDNPGSDMVTQLSGRFTLMEDIIREGWAQRFRELPYHDEVVLGLITNLVLAHSTEFIGTPGSTFTAYIHRQQQHRGKCDWRFLDGIISSDQNPLNNTPSHPPGRYSWVEYPTQPTWWREWPECSWIY